MTRFIVMTSSAAVSSTQRSFLGRYRNVAVVEAEDGIEPKMISKRAKGVVRIVRVWKKQFVGKSMDCQYQRALAQARVLAERMENEAH